MNYNVGMFGGSFNPLHMGHVRCLLQAANQCKELYVALFAGNNQIDYRVRYRWIYSLTKHIGNVTILVFDDECDSKDEYTLELAIKDSERIKNKIGKHIDVVFCGSDYDENSFFTACYPDSELVIFQRDECNSTAIRENPYAHWDWIPNVAKPYYAKKVLLIGGESTGKSTLTINLANHYNTNYLEEVGRDISLRSGTDELMLDEDFTEILLTHKLEEIKALEKSNKLLFIDTDALITKFYLGFLQGEAIGKNVSLADAIDRINSYDLILFLEPDVEFVQDGTRNEPIAKEREMYSQQIKDIFSSHNKQFVCISGDYQQRYQQAISAIDKLIYRS